MKNIFLLLPVCFLLACHHETAVNKVLFKADLDTVYNNASGTHTIPLDSEKIHDLTNLGMLWGFIKYYHASVNQGNFNMDAELFRVLPKVLAARNPTEANTVMGQWVDHFGVPGICKNCKEVKKTAATKLMPDYGYLFDTGNFPLSLIRKLAFIRDNRDTSQAHYYVGVERYARNPVFTHEVAYNDAYPDAGVRLLALYRYWNMIQYFFPDRHLIGEDWNKVLPEFIPSFCNAKDTLAYQLACLKLIARIHDTHAQLYGDYALQKMRGSYYTPFKAAFVEGKLVVTGYYADSTAGIMNQVDPGDVIEQIDGVPVDSLVKKYLQLTPASNYSTQLQSMSASNGWLLRGQVPDIHLLIRRNGFVISADVQRSNNNPDYNAPFNRPFIMDGNIGYIYPASLQDNDIDSLKTRFKDTKGIILDMRCYPGTFMPYTYGAWFKMLSSPFVISSKPSVTMPGWFGLTDTFRNGQVGFTHYTGKLVIIVNGQTLSQAEFTTMALSTVHGAVVIGDTTAGADGNVSAVNLPGGLASQISGLGEIYPDGTESQRAGVKIDHFIAPTIAGIRARRDEQLEYAIKLINGK